MYESICVITKTPRNPLISYYCFHLCICIFIENSATKLDQNITSYSWKGRQIEKSKMAVLEIFWHTWVHSKGVAKISAYLKSTLNSGLEYNIFGILIFLGFLCFCYMFTSLISFDKYLDKIHKHIDLWILKISLVAEVT